MIEKTPIVIKKNEVDPAWDRLIQFKIQKVVWLRGLVRKLRVSSILHKRLERKSGDRDFGAHFVVFIESTIAKELAAALTELECISTAKRIVRIKI